MASTLKAGAATVDVTPSKPCFLYGYPHVPRTSTGVHDPLLAAALVLESGAQSCAFIAADVIFVNKAITQRVRARIAQATGLREETICISATHTHSGPVTVQYLSNETDPVVPPVDGEYLSLLEDGLVAAGVQAWRERRPAEVGFALADATGIGTCRHDPHGPGDLSVPVLMAREAGGGRAIGLMLICAMHPTVLHEDSTLISADFPGFARRYLQERLVGESCPVIYHTGASGDQSPRHVTQGNTFSEASRLGHLLGAGVERAMKDATYSTDLPLQSARRLVNLPRREAPPLQAAQERVHAARARLDQLITSAAPRTEVRTAECDWFGAQETLAIARAASEGRLDDALRASLPAEIQALVVGSHVFIAWPGEFFVEFALKVRTQFPAASIITLANGELQGYAVTAQAAANQWYEAGNSLLKNPEAGDTMVRSTLELLHKLKESAHA